MAAITVTYSFTNSTTADATQVNTNFTDIINGTSSGTKDFNIGSLIVSGATTFNGSVTLGDGTPDDITWSGSLASTIPIKTNNSFNFGSSTLGLASIYLGSAGGLTTRLVGGATGSSWTMTLPISAGTNLQYMQTDGSGVTSWATVRRDPRNTQNYSISTSINANAMTINLLAQDGNTPSASNSVDVLFRNTTAATGDSTLISVTSALSVVVPSGATLGLKSAVDQYMYLYIMNNGGTPELCVAGNSSFDQGTLQSSTAISSGSTDSVTLYGTSGRASKPVRLLGRILSNQTVAGTYAANSTEIALFTGNPEKSNRSMIRLDTCAGHGSGATCILRWTNVTETIGTAITYTSDSTNGDKFTINEDGVYAITLTTSGAVPGITKNETGQASTNINAVTQSILLACSYASSGGGTSVTAFLKKGDIIRGHDNGGGAVTGSPYLEVFVITKVSS